MPAPTLAQFHTTVSRHMNKGSSLDAIIPDTVRQQARFLEQNYSFNYMDRFVEVTLPADCRGFNAPSLVKRFNFIRFVYDDEDFAYLEHTSPLLVSRLSTTERPVAWWHDSDDKIFFDAVLSEETDLELSYVQYTDWPTDTSATPKLLIHGEAILLYASVMALAPYVRNPEMRQEYSALLKDALTAITGAQEDYKTSAGTLQMGYS